MTLAIEIAPPTVSQSRLAQAGAISLPGSSALPGFASLLSGLLDQNANTILTTATRDQSAARNERFSFRLQNRDTNAQRTAGDAVLSTKPAQHKSDKSAGVLKPAAVHAGETQTLFPMEVWDPPAQPAGKDVTSLIPGRASASPPSLPSQLSPPAPWALLPRSSASAVLPETSRPTSALEKAPSAGNVAFALQLSWQQPSTRTPEEGLASTVGASAVGDATVVRARVSAAANILTAYEQGPHESLSPVADAQPDRPKPSATSLPSPSPLSPIRSEVVSPASSGAVFQRLSSTHVTSPPGTDAIARLPQIPGNNTILDATSAKDATSANPTGDIQSKTQEASPLPARIPAMISAQIDDRTPEQSPAGPGNRPPSDESMPVIPGIAFREGKPTSAPARISGNAQVTRPASGPPTGDSESATAGDAETKPAAKAPGDVPEQKLAPSPGNHENSGMPADGYGFGRSAGPSEAAGARTQVVAPETSRPAASTEAAPAPPAPSIREVSLHLAASTSTPVDVQLAAKAGKIQVAVRTPDVDLAKSLQSNLGELVGRLAEKGFKTEAWTPQTAVHSVLVPRQAAASTANQGHSDTSGSPGGQPDARGGQRQSGHRQPGRWQAQFEATLSAPDAAPPPSD